MSNRRYLPRSRGITIIEMIVSAIIIGVAIAGITEITWVNANWTIGSLNKMDSHFAARLFMDRLNHDLRSASSIDATSNNQTLTINRTADGELDDHGFPLAPTPVTYAVQPSAGTIPPTYSVLYSDGTQNLVLLTGLMGPTGVGGGLPKVFQYVDKNVDTGDETTWISDAPSNNVGSVVVNLELRRTDYGGRPANENYGIYRSTAGFRTELFLRNNIGMD